jgi:hypothetical protein
MDEFFSFSQRTCRQTDLPLYADFLHHPILPDFLHTIFENLLPHAQGIPLRRILPNLLNRAQTYTKTDLSLTEKL